MKITINKFTHQCQFLTKNVIIDDDYDDNYKYKENHGKDDSNKCDHIEDNYLKGGHNKDNHQDKRRQRFFVV